MAIAFRLDGALLPYQTVRLTGSNPNAPGGVQGLPSSAWYGEPMTAGVVIEDPDGTLDIVGWHTFTVEETDCSKPRIFTGWITGKAISRGSYRTGAGRIWNCDIIDQNALFSFEVFRAQSAQRPAETDLARVIFAQASAPMAFTPAHDNGRFNTTDNPVNFGDSNYVGQYPVELYTSVAGTSGKNFYAYWSDADQQISLHYDLTTANPASTLRISNVAADIDSTTTFGPFIDAELRRSPEDVYTGILFNYRGAYAYGRRPATIDDLSPTEFSPTEWHRDLVYSTDRVGRLETANALIASMLDVKSTEMDDINVSVQLPASKVNLIHAGDKVQVKFSHLPGYTSFTYMAVIRRNVVPTDNHDGLYDVHLELSNRSAPRGPGGGPPGVFPHRPQDCDIADVGIVQDVNSSLTFVSGTTWSWPAWDTTPTVGNLLVASSGLGDISTPAGWTRIAGPETTEFVGLGGAGGSVIAWWKIADGDDTLPNVTSDDLGSSKPPNAYLIELSGVDALDTFASGQADPGGLDFGVTITPTAGNVAFLLTVGSYSQTLSGRLNPDSGVTELFDEKTLSQPDPGHPQWWVGYREVASTTGTYDVNGTFSGGFNVAWGSITMAFYCSGTDLPCPDAGQWVRGEVVEDNANGTQTVFTTACPYADGSLTVYVDRLDQTAAVTTFNGATGSFTLGFAPPAGCLIEADYQGR